MAKMVIVNRKTLETALRNFEKERANAPPELEARAEIERRFEEEKHRRDAEHPSRASGPP